MDKERPLQEQKQVRRKSWYTLLFLALLTVSGGLILVRQLGVEFSSGLKVFDRVLHWIILIDVIAMGTFRPYQKYIYGEKFPGFVLQGLPRPVQVAVGILLVVDLLIVLACIVLLLR